MAQVSEEQFRDKVAEVVEELGVAIASVVRPTSDENVRTEWHALGRSFAELMEMRPPG